jgi:hypothetical protein
VKDPVLTKDCGPHCKVKTGGQSGVTVRIVHCKRRKCTQCHRKTDPAGRW